MKGAGLALLCAVGSSLVHADGAPATAPVRVVIDAACGALDVAEVRRIVALELRPRVSAGPVDQPGERWATHVSAECDEREVKLRVDDPLSRKSLERVVVFGAAPETRARLVALAISELVLASWTELLTNPHPQAVPSGAAPPEPLAEAARDTAAQHLVPEATTTTRVWITGGPHLFGDAVLWGGGLRWGLERPSLFGFEVDLRLDHGSRTDELGQLVADRVTASLVPHLFASRWGLRWRVGAGARGGPVRISGVAAGPEVRARSGVAPWLGALAVLGASLTIGAFTAEAQLEGGISLVPVVGRAGGVDRLALRGGWLAFELGVGIAP